MDYDKLRDLIAKYWAGETELLEEKQIKDFFSEAFDLPEDLEIERKIFTYFQGEANSPALKEDLTTRLRSQWSKTLEKPVKKISIWKEVLQYAAIVLPLMIIGYFIIQKDKAQTVTTYQTDTFDDPKKAIAETEKALVLLSKNMNDGLGKMQELKMFEEVKNSKKIKDK